MLNLVNKKGYFKLFILQNKTNNPTQPPFCQSKLRKIVCFNCLECGKSNKK